MSLASDTESKYRNSGVIKKEEENISDSGYKSRRDIILEVLESLAPTLPLKRPSNGNELLNSKSRFIPLHSLSQSISTVKTESIHVESNPFHRSTIPPLPLLKQEKTNPSCFEEKTHTISEVLKYLSNTNVESKAYFDVNCIISEQDLFSQKLWIKCCRYSQCRKKVLKLKDSFYCLKCNEDCYQCIRLYRFEIKLSDSTGAIDLKVKDSEGRILFRNTAEELWKLKKENFSKFYRTTRKHCGVKINAVIQASVKNGNWKLSLVKIY